MISFDQTQLMRQSPKKYTVNFLGGMLHLPTSNSIDKPLIFGAILFGAGCGLAGFCPGPALISLVSGQLKGTVFMVFMVSGIIAYTLYYRRTKPSNH
ncbi:MAG: hypothetical protein EXR35_04460 [Limnohabitans sp.]|nr:hypothetical protein [Limnohabitans sp.]